MSNYQDVARQAAHRANDRRGGCTVAELADAVLAAVLAEQERAGNSSLNILKQSAPLAPQTPEPRSSRPPCWNTCEQAACLESGRCCYV